MEAELALGLMRLDASEEAKVNLPRARHSIDLLGVLEEKTRGNLSIEEKRLLENTLTELRFRFLQIPAQPSA